MKHYHFALMCILVLAVSCIPTPKQQLVVFVTATPWMVAATPAPTSTPMPTATPTSTPMPTATPTNTPTSLPIGSHGDLHLHTTCSDGANSYEETVQRALSFGYDFIAITDHRFGGLGSPCGAIQGKCDDALCNEVVRKCRKEERLLCIPGTEISGQSGHMLAIGIQRGINGLLPMQAQVDEIHRQGGLAILAHPWSMGVRYDDPPVNVSGLDAMECSSSSLNIVPSHLELLVKSGVPCVYTSDAHNVYSMAKNTMCDVKVKSLEDLRVALKDKKCRDGTLKD